MIIAQVSEGCVLSCCYPEAISASTHEPHLCQKWINAGEGKIFLKGMKEMRPAVPRTSIIYFCSFIRFFIWQSRGHLGPWKRREKGQEVVTAPNVPAVKECLDDML